MILSRKQIKQYFQVSDTLTTQVRAFIRKHPERYGPYSVAGIFTHGGAFLDAYTYRKAINRGEAVPDYNEEMAVRMVNALMKED